MDDELQRRSGKSIPELTKNGTDWQTFREGETSLLRELLSGKETVISAGGGVGVNAHVDARTGRTFGEEQREIVRLATQVLVVLLTAPTETLAERIRADEMLKEQITRPVLDETRARALAVQLEAAKDDPARAKERLVSGIVEDSLATYRIREPLYNTLSDTAIDTSRAEPGEIAERIAAIVTGASVAAGR
jgi:shikimate kinase